MVDGVLVKVLGWDNLVDDLLLDLLAELLSGDGLSVLARKDNGVNAEWNNGTAIVLVLHGDLGLGIWTQPWDGSVTAGTGHLGVQGVGELEGQWEELWGLIGSITEHDTLVTGTELLKSLVVVKTLGDIWGLLLNGDEDVASLVIESLGGIIVSDVLDGTTDDLLVVELGLSGNLSENHYHSGLGSGLASNLGEGVLSQAGIENGIRDLVSDLIWVSLTDGLRLEEELVYPVLECAICLPDTSWLLTVNRKLPTLWWLPRMAVPLRWPLVVPLVAIVNDVFVRIGHLIATSVMRMDREERERKRFRGEEDGRRWWLIVGQRNNFRGIGLAVYLSEKGIIHGKTRRATFWQQLTKEG